MAVIANLYFPSKGNWNINVQEEKWILLFNRELNVKEEDFTRFLFTRKIVPILVFCGASIATTFIEKSRMYSYEVIVEDETSFLNELRRLQEDRGFQYE